MNRGAVGVSGVQWGVSGYHTQGDSKDAGLYRNYRRVPFLKNRV